MLVDTGVRVEKVMINEEFPCTCGKGKVGKGIAYDSKTRAYRFACAGCLVVFHVSVSGGCLYRVERELVVTP